MWTDAHTLTHSLTYHPFASADFKSIVMKRFLDNPHSFRLNSFNGILRFGCSLFLIFKWKLSTYLQANQNLVKWTRVRAEWVAMHKHTQIFSCKYWCLSALSLIRFQFSQFWFLCSHYKRLQIEIEGVREKVRKSGKESHKWWHRAASSISKLGRTVLRKPQR